MTALATGVCAVDVLAGVADGECDGLGESVVIPVFDGRGS
jgi:hypothetical protein